MRSTHSNSDWQAGTFNAADAFKTYNFGSLSEKIKHYVDDEHVKFVPGYFNESCTPELAKTLRPALYVDVDIYLYISTVQALGFMLRHKLLVVGSVIGYDDWPAGGVQGGEQRAHRELTRVWGLRWLNLVPGCKESTRMQCVFELLAVGSDEPDCDCLGVIGAHITDPARYVQRKGSGGELMRTPKLKPPLSSSTPTTQGAARGNGRIKARDLQALARRHAFAYSIAQPYKHLVLDDFLPQKLALGSMRELQAKHAEGPSFWKTRNTSMGFKRGRGGYPANTQGGDFGQNTAKLFDFFQSRRFVAFLETLTGIHNLTTDSHMYGIFSIINGGYLSLHTDFNKHLQCSKADKHRQLQLSTEVAAGCSVVTPGCRRINVLLYLNQDWLEEWGGSFELWETDREYSSLDYHTKILPLLNRLVIFSVTDISIHGHLDVVNHPQGDTRKSLSFYYYSPTIDNEPLITPLLHESLYMPSHAKARSIDRWRKMTPKYIVR